MRSLMSCTVALLLLFTPSSALPDEPFADNRSFTPGPSLTDSNNLLLWFKAHPETYVQLPAVIEFSSEAPHPISRAWIASSTDDPPQDAIFLLLDDKLFTWMDAYDEMRVDFNMNYRLRSLCAERVRCVLRIGGHWGQAIRPMITRWPPPDPLPDAPPYPFALKELDPLEGVPAWLMVSVQ